MKPEDKLLFARLITADQLGILLYLEARGEPVEGQIAVGCVVRNRTRSKLGYFDVITAPEQFSCMNSNDPNYSIGMNMVKDLIAGHAPEDLTGLLAQCRWVAQGIVNGAIKDNTSGSMYYYNPKVVTPSWAKAMTVVRQIGNHIFLKG